MSRAATSPEKPRHIDERITAIGIAGLLDAFGNPASVDDLAALRAWVARGKREALWPIGQWAKVYRGSDEAAAVIAGAEQLRRDPPDVTGAGLGRSARYGFHYLGWLEPVVRAWALTGDDTFVRTFEELFQAWVRGRDGLVGEWPGLDLIWYSLGTWARASLLLPALDVLGRALSDEVWAEVMGTLAGGARWAYDEHDTFRHGNWQLVSATHLLHIGSVYPCLVEAGPWIQRGRARLVEHLEHDFYADGGHHERSPGYHALCLDATQLAVAVDQRCLRTGLATHPRVAAIHHWLRELTSSGGWAPHLQDSGVVWSGRHMLRGGHLLGDGALHRAARRWLPADELDRQAAAIGAASPGDGQDAGPEEPEESVLLAESGYAVLRADPGTETATGTDTGDGVRVVVNAGPYVGHELESHSHRAVLDLVLEGWGRPLLWEAGGPPDYDDERYESWFRAGRGHNTVLVDGRDAGAGREVGIDTFRESAGVTVFAACAEVGGSVHHRRLVLVRPDPAYLVVFDTVLDVGRHTYELLWNAPAPWIEDDGLWRTAGLPGVRLWVDRHAGTTAARSEGSARLPDPATRTAEYAPLYTLSLARTHGRFTTVVAPVADERPWSVAASGESLRITHPAGTDLVDTSGLTRLDARDTVLWQEDLS